MKPARDADVWKEIFFVRHGESESNADGMHRGSTSLLTHKGSEQAELVAERVERLNVETLISTSFPRARHTAERIAARIGLPIEENDLFIERRQPSFIVGRSIEDPDVRTAMTEVFDGYLTPNHRYSDEENLEDLRERANAGLAFLATRSSKRICVVTHGFFLRVLFCSAVYGPHFNGTHLQGAVRSLDTGNTGISHFRLMEDTWADNQETSRWHVTSWNDVMHLG